MRRRLGYSVAEADALPWWVHETYVRGLIEEFADPDAHDSMVAPGTPGTLAEQGFTVRNA